MLLFSYSTRMLDLVGAMLARAGYAFQRLDGTTKQAERQKLVDAFNTSPSAFLFLISTGAGSLGLNLTGANKCVCFYLRSIPTHIRLFACEWLHLVSSTQSTVLQPYGMRGGWKGAPCATWEAFYITRLCACKAATCLTA